MDNLREIKPSDATFVGNTKLNQMLKEVYSGALGSPVYTSQTRGWKVTPEGSADFRYLYADQMHVKCFIADLEQALAGGQIVSKSVAKVAAAFTIPAAGTTGNLVVEEFAGYTGHVFANGDIVRLRQMTRANNTTLDVSDVWGTVVYLTRNAYAKPTPQQTYSFTRSLAPNAGAAIAYTIIAAGTLALDYGTTGNGYYEVTAVDGVNGVNSPYAQVASWATHPATGCTVKSRFGNLAGITDADFGGALTGYGFYGSNVYVKGKIVMTNQGSIAISGFNNDAGFITSASAGNHTYYQSSAPTGMVTGDFWFDTGTTGQYKMKRWNGATWDIVSVYMDGSGVYAGSITAGQVTAGTFTGFTFQTAASGKRVEIRSSDNELEFYEAAGSKVRIGSNINGSGLAGIKLADGYVYMTVPDGKEGIYVWSSDYNSHAAISVLTYENSGIKTGIKAQASGSGTNIAFLANASGGNSNYCFYSDAGDMQIAGKISAILTTEQQRLGYDASNYIKLTVGATGNTTLTAVGTNPSITLTGGTVGIGIAANATVDIYCNKHQTIIDGTHYGILFSPRFAVTDAGTQDNLFGMLFNPTTFSTTVANITSVFGAFYRVDNNSTAGSVIANVYANYIANPTGAGSITHNIGLYIENQTKGATTNYAIYSAGGMNYFGGSINIASGQTYQINGTALAYGDVGAAASGHNHSGVYAALSAGGDLSISISTSTVNRVAITASTFGNNSTNHTGLSANANSTDLTGVNVAVSASASGGASNYSFQGSNGILYNADDIVTGGVFKIGVNNLIGTGATNAAAGNHDHSGVYSPLAHDHSGVYAALANGASFSAGSASNAYVASTSGGSPTTRLNLIPIAINGVSHGFLVAP
jgi:hypothetical protein